ncbi:MAG: 3-phosphoshikimate 1-carboxyvinyltransferase [Cyclobacteriaceae bacterium]|nr:MAG: 3-phosphoshikimate 1-carboxyvinyltransferase [Cyclobacteriaceae bacterium]
MISSTSLSFPKIHSINPASIKLAASKSISNRVLIIDALCDKPSKLQNLSEARDTRLMIKLLAEPSEIIDVKDAGTTMRFLTGYFSLTNQHKLMTGTPRMQQRPIGILANALQTLGADIEYLAKTGYPPLRTCGFPEQKTDKIQIPGDISSQYISSLLMMSPALPLGLHITMTGKIMSRPYIEMTLGLMNRFGVSYSWKNQEISIPSQKYQPTTIKVESDWSAASYWYSIVALSRDTEITLLGLEEQSLQGDRQIAAIMKELGVVTQFHQSGVTLSRTAVNTRTLNWDFSSCPDLGPTVMATCAALGVSCHATGLESLRIKETDRIAALQKELSKIGARLLEDSGKWTLQPVVDFDDSMTVTFDTYEDHRMAMALAPLALRLPVTINDPKVVRKSYPGFWNDLSLVGFRSID